MLNQRYFEMNKMNLSNCIYNSKNIQRMDSQSSRVNNKECIQVLKQYFPKSEFQVLGYDLKPLKELGTYEVEYTEWTIKYIKEERVAKLVKEEISSVDTLKEETSKEQTSKEQTSKEETIKVLIKTINEDKNHQLVRQNEAGIFKKEFFVHFILLKDFQVLLDSDLTFVTKCHLLLEDVAVFENPFTHGFRPPSSNFKSQSSSPNFLDLDHLKVALKALAKFHSVTLILEDSINDPSYKLEDDYKQFFQEPIFFEEDSGWKFQLASSIVKGLNFLLDANPTSTNSKLKENLNSYLEEFLDLVRTGRKFRKVCCHGDLRHKTLLFNYEDGRPKECKLMNFHLQRYVPPAFDVLHLIVFEADEETRKKYLEELLEFYYYALGEEIEDHMDQTRMLGNPVDLIQTQERRSSLKMGGFGFGEIRNSEEVRGNSLIVEVDTLEERSNCEEINDEEINNEELNTVETNNKETNNEDTNNGETNNGETNNENVIKLVTKNEEITEEINKIIINDNTINEDNITFPQNSKLLPQSNVLQNFFPKEEFEVSSKHFLKAAKFIKILFEFYDLLQKHNYEKHSLTNVFVIVKLYSIQQEFKEEIEEKLDNLRNIVTNTILIPEDICDVVSQKLKTKNFEILEESLEEESDKGGFLGNNYFLKVRTVCKKERCDEIKPVEKCAGKLKEEKLNEDSLKVKSKGESATTESAKEEMEKEDQTDAVEAIIDNSNSLEEHLEEILNDLEESIDEKLEETANKTDDGSPEKTPKKIEEGTGEDDQEIFEEITWNFEENTGNFDENTDIFEETPGSFEETPDNYENTPDNSKETTNNFEETIQTQTNTCNFFVKCAPSGGESLDYFLKTGAGYKEYAFFKKILPTLKSQNINLLEECVPKCFKARLNDVYILEDLKSQGYKILSHRYSMGFEEVYLVLKTMAKMHASILIYEERFSGVLGRPYRIIEDFSESFKEAFGSNLPVCVTSMKATKKGLIKLIRYFSSSSSSSRENSLSEDTLNINEFEEKAVRLFENISEMVQPSSKYRNTLTHGDLWANNIFFKIEENGEEDIRIKFDEQVCRGEDGMVEVEVVEKEVVEKGSVEKTEIEEEKVEELVVKDVEEDVEEKVEGGFEEEIEGGVGQGIEETRTEENTVEDYVENNDQYQVENFKHDATKNQTLKQITLKEEINEEKFQKTSDCKIIDFQSYRYNTPAQDVLSFLFFSTNRKFRQQHLPKALDYYYEELKKNLKEHQIDPDDIVTYKDFLESCQEARLFATAYTPMLIYGLSSEVMNSFFAQEDKCEIFFKEDRSVLTLEQCEADEVYREIQRDVVLNFKDLIDESLI